MATVEQVFYHELGHFVANELNRIYYSGLGVSSISIFPCKEDPSKFCGGTTPIKPVDHDENEKKPPPLERLAEYLARVVHGCIFQSYYQQVTLDQCLEINGQNDQGYWNGALISYNLFYNRKIFFEIQNNYDQKVQKNKLLESFMSLNPIDYLIESKPDHYDVDLEKLSENIHASIENYFPCYRTLVDSYQNEINKTGN